MWWAFALVLPRSVAPHQRVRRRAILPPSLSRETLVRTANGGGQRGGMLAKPRSENPVPQRAGFFV
jgi:hypothetical protein